MLLSVEGAGGSAATVGLLREGPGIGNKYKTLSVKMTFFVQSKKQLRVFHSRSWSRRGAEDY